MGVSVSICIPTYNQGRYLGVAIDSCLAQKEPADEIVVSDNWSTDETQQVLERYRATRQIRVVRPPQHLTMERHQRFAAAMAQGSHVGLLHGDDAYAPNFVRVVKRVLGKNPEIGLVAPAIWRCDENMKPLQVGGIRYPRECLPPPRGFERMIRDCGYTVSASVWSVEALNAVPELPEGAALFFDWYYALCIGANHPVQMIRRPLHYRRFHGENASLMQAHQMTCSGLLMLHHVMQLSTIHHHLRRQLAPAELTFARMVLNLVPLSEDERPHVAHARQIAHAVVAQHGLTDEDVKFKPHEAWDNRVFRSLSWPEQLANRLMLLLLGGAPQYLSAERN